MKLLILILFIILLILLLQSNIEHFSNTPVCSLVFSNIYTPYLKEKDCVLTPSDSCIIYKNDICLFPKTDIFIHDIFELIKNEPNQDKIIDTKYGMINYHLINTSTNLVLKNQINIHMRLFTKINKKIFDMRVLNICDENGRLDKSSILPYLSNSNSPILTYFDLLNNKKPIYSIALAINTSATKYAIGISDSLIRAEHIAILQAIDMEPNTLDPTAAPQILFNKKTTYDSLNTLYSTYFGFNSIQDIPQSLIKNTSELNKIMNNLNKQKIDKVGILLVNDSVYDYPLTNKDSIYDDCKTLSTNIHRCSDPCTDMFVLYKDNNVCKIKSDSLTLDPKYNFIDSDQLKMIKKTYPVLLRNELNCNDCYVL